MKLFQNNNSILLVLVELHINIYIYTLETVVVVTKEIDEQLCLIQMHNIYLNRDAKLTSSVT